MNKKTYFVHKKLTHNNAVYEPESNIDLTDEEAETLVHDNIIELVADKVAREEAEKQRLEELKKAEEEKAMGQF